ncbi:Carbon-nitrogen hydrolase [Elasticomyces elasticus]|nr:Carbon-nitrogen hydrolase [Elasticomyces elasticus]
MAHNLAQCRTLVQKAAAAGAKALFLPEACDYVGSSPEESITLAKPVESSPFLQGLRSEARKHSLPINVGVHEPIQDGKKVKNTLLWINEKGDIVQRYQKLHLFEMDVEGDPPMHESKTTEAGSEILPPFDTILRFPEIALALRRQNAQVLTYPSAFTTSTGRAHWHVLLRARAIEMQAYVLAAAQVGSHNEKRSSYGHSIIITPWGEVIAELGGEKSEEPEIAVADIDLGNVEKIRKEMHLLRRTDVYPEV